MKKAKKTTKKKPPAKKKVASAKASASKASRVSRGPKKKSVKAGSLRKSEKGGQPVHTTGASEIAKTSAATLSPLERAKQALGSQTALVHKVEAKPVYKPKSSAPPLKPVERPKAHKVIQIKAPQKSKKPERAPLTPSVSPADPDLPAEAAKPQEMKTLVIQAPILVKSLAAKLVVKPGELIGRFIKAGVFANINQSVNFDTASVVAKEYGYILEKPQEKIEAASKEAVKAKDTKHWKSRPPIVTFMGHVDHGKTSLLDAIRKTKVVHQEAGGITQHIGAYEVFLDRGAVTFLDTPGHEAFTAMRARGAQVTDVVVLVIAADDSIKPQTLEAIDHARAADATIVVAINKIDLPNANIDRVKKDLSDHGLTPEDWGGKTVTTNVSAKTGEGIDKLLEMLLLEAEMLELRADHESSPKGVVIEAKLTPGAGPVATALIQEGTLRVGDVIRCGKTYGRLRSMVNDRGQRIREASPAMPVEIAGLSGVPQAGDPFYRVASEAEAREILEAEHRENIEKGDHHAHITLEEVYSEVHAGHIKALKLIIKSDVQGSVEALRKTLMQIQANVIKLQIIHTGTGNVTKSDVMLAAASNAIVIGFHVGITPDAAGTIKQEEVDVRLYQIIYEVRTAIERAMSGLLPPKIVENFVGSAEIRQLFKISKFGLIAGSMVTKGKIVRNAPCRVIRNGQKIFEGKISGLKRFKDDAREVQEGFECGINIGNFKDLAEGDKIEVYEVESKQDTL